MPADESDDRPPADRQEPVGAPVVRGDPEITGAHTDEAATFDPDDPDSLSQAASIVREFADAPDEDHLSVLRGAAACAALVRGEGSYKAAAERADVSVEFLRTWARVHDLPISIRRHIARGDIAPSAAKHVARVAGDARFLLAWAALDGDLPVEEVRQVASDVTDGTSIERALADYGVDLGRIDVTLSAATYRELRRRASLRDRSPDSIVADAIDGWLAERR